jgi:hypothetical protein
VALGITSGGSGLEIFRIMIVTIVVSITTITPPMAFVIIPSIFEKLLKNFVKISIAYPSFLKC